jgi:DNA-binding transcriptional regulator GbsR (MarR family)
MNEEEISKAKNEIEQLAHSTRDQELQEATVEDLKKLEHTIEYYNWLKRLVQTFQSGEIFDYVPKKK